MGANSTIAVTPGSGATLVTYDVTAGKYQYVREFDATALTHGAWTLSTTAATSQIAADIQRAIILMVNTGGSRVYMRFDSTAPTSAVHHWYLDPGDRYEVPHQLVNLAVSFVADAAVGSLTYALGTAA